MSANLIDALFRSGKLRSFTFADARHEPERRSRLRTPVHWPVTFFRPDSPERVESSTLNLSSEGFYCLTDVPFAPGEHILALLHAPSCHPAERDATRVLRCQVRVLRVEPLDGRYGIACRIEDYQLTPANGRVTSA